MSKKIVVLILGCGILAITIQIFHRMESEAVIISLSSGDQQPPQIKGYETITRNIPILAVAPTEYCRTKSVPESLSSFYKLSASERLDLVTRQMAEKRLSPDVLAFFKAEIHTPELDKDGIPIPPQIVV